jgi:uncharacterized YccA/Bax inhibitor family protein
MTLAGTMNKTVLLFMLLIASAMVIWWMAFNGANPLVPAIAGAIAGLASGYCCIQTAHPLFSSRIRVI